MEPESPALQVDSLPSELPGKPNRRFILVLSVCLFKDYLLLLLILFTVFIPLLMSPVFYYFLSFESVNLKLLLSLLKVED